MSNTLHGRVYRYGTHIKGHIEESEIVNGVTLYRVNWDGSPGSDPTQYTEAQLQRGERAPRYASLKYTPFDRLTTETNKAEQAMRGFERRRS